MKIRILKTIEEAGKAEGLVVMIDVFRAFSLECYLFAAGARRIYPVKDLEEARAAAAAHEDCILIGEEGDARAEGCMYGDSPWQTGTGEVAGKRYDGKPDILHLPCTGFVAESDHGARRTRNITPDGSVNAAFVGCGYG